VDYFFREQVILYIGSALIDITKTKELNIKNWGNVVAIHANDSSVFGICADGTVLCEGIFSGETDDWDLW
jgi:hypothetical protein